MSKCKKCLLTLLCTLICLFNALPLSAFASETQYDVIFPFSEPYVSDNQGYIVYEMKDSDGNLFYYLYYITCIPTNYVDTSADGSNNLPSAKPLFRVMPTSVANSKTTFSIFVGIEDNYSYMVQGTFYYSSGRPYYQDPHFIQGGGTSVGYTLTYLVPLDLTFNNYYCKGPFMTAGGLVPFDPTLKVGFLGDDSNYYNQLQDIINKLSILHSDNTELINKFVSVINALSTLHNDNVEQTAKLSELISLLIENNSDNEQMLLKLADLLSDTNSLVDITDAILTYCKIYLPNIEEVLWYIDDELFTVIEKLDVIIDLLQPDTDINVSSVDPSNFNEYNKAEQSLLDNSNVDVSGALNVEIDQNALLYIWPLVESTLNTHPQVIGLVFTILSISIVALVLGRKGG